MLKKPQYLILIVVVLIVLALLKLPAETMGKVKLAISGLFLPLFGLAGSTHQIAEKVGNTLTPRQDLLKQIEQLKTENQEQKIQIEQDANVLSENARLRAALNWQRQAKWRVKLARVIARDPANWWRSLQINLGKHDEIRENLPVVTSEGLVGRIQSVSDSRAQVILLGDPEFRVAAVIGGTNETGIITASSSSPQEQGMIDLDMLSGASLVHPGQDVFTWGAGGIFPGGIPIGKIVDTHPKDYGLSIEARVKLAANLGALEEVWVMVP
ncbi:MAG TPA: rod shape-determining protein MreC [Verrucomicrobiae bacterium]|jgi:rod shape-determining protein MreC